MARAGGSGRQRRHMLIGLVALVLTVSACLPHQVDPHNAPVPLPGRSNGYLPDHLLTPVGGSCRLHYEAAESFTRLRAAAAHDGVHFGSRPLGCYRTFAGQVQLRNEACARNECHMAAVPGTSNHGWGKAVDLYDQGGTLDFDSRGYHWLVANAHRFGWFHRFDVTQQGIAPEAWHWEWVGDGGRLHAGQYFGDGNVPPLGSTSPAGSLDAAGVSRTALSHNVNLRGWALDPSTPGSSIELHTYLGGTRVSTGTANAHRSDIGFHWPAYQYQPHGIDQWLPVPHGTHDLCTWAINTGPGVNVRIGCHRIAVDRSPFGSLDLMSRSDAELTVGGWAVDPDTMGPIEIHAYLGPRFLGSAVADQHRPDIVGLTDPRGPDHGFAATFPIDPAEHGGVCVWAVNVATGDSIQLGCASI